VVKTYTQEELGGFIPPGSRVVWWSDAKYGGLPIGAVYQSKGQIEAEGVGSDVAIFENAGTFYTIDLWTDEIIRVHAPEGEAPDRQLTSRTHHEQALITTALLTRYGGGKGSIEGD